MAADEVFRALADPTRRRLLDALREQSGRTLSELCAGLEMRRQSASQHLELLERAGLISTVRDGRRKLHYLNPVPIYEIQSRWIGKFEQPRLATLDAIKQRAERTAMNETPETGARAAAPVPDYVYVTYIRASPEDVWQALTDPDITAQYWRMRNVSDWQPGARWEHRPLDDRPAAVQGRVLEAERPRRLVFTWRPAGDCDDGTGESRVTFLIEPVAEVVRLTVFHEQLPDEAVRGAIAQGWPAVLSNLKSLLETGELLPAAFWDDVHPAAAPLDAANDPAERHETNPRSTQR